MTKETFRLEDPADIESAIAVALEAPRRPVFVEIPTDRLSARGPRWDVGEFAPEVVADEPDVGDALELLAGAWKPLIWAGGGALDAGPEVAELARRLGAPILTTFSSRGLVGAEDPCAVGLPPHLPAVGELWDEADVVIAIGTDFDGMNTMNWRLPRPQKLLSVNVDGRDAMQELRGRRAGRGRRGARRSRAGRRAAAGRRRRLGRPRDGPPPRARLAARRPPARDRVLGGLRPGRARRRDRGRRHVHPGLLAGRHVRARRARAASSTRWGGGRWATRSRRRSARRRPGRRSRSAATAASCLRAASWRRPSRSSLPLTVVVVDDGGYGMLRFDQAQSGAEPFGVDLETPDFVALAGAFGVRASAVEGVGEDFAAALARAPGRSGAVAAGRARGAHAAADDLAALVPRGAAGVGGPAGWAGLRLAFSPPRLGSGGVWSAVRPGGAEGGWRSAAGRWSGFAAGSVGTEGVRAGWAVRGASGSSAGARGGWACLRTSPRMTGPPRSRDGLHRGGSVRSA